MASVAESTVIFGPICQVGCASASARVTPSSSSRVRPRNGPPDAVSTRDSDRLERAPLEALEGGGVLAVDGQEQTSAPLPGREGEVPAATRLSLLASASVTPRSSAQSVAGSPAKPTTAFSTTSGEDSSRSAVRSPPTWTCRTPRVAASSSSSLDPDASAHTSSSGLASMISSA